MALLNKQTKQNKKKIVGFDHLKFELALYWIFDQCHFLVK